MPLDAVGRPKGLFRGSRPRLSGTQRRIPHINSKVNLHYAAVVHEDRGLQLAPFSGEKGRTGGARSALLGCVTADWLAQRRDGPF